jgi:hypothetical protein
MFKSVTRVVVDPVDIQLVYEGKQIVNGEDLRGVACMLIELLPRQEVVAVELVFVDLDHWTAWEAYVVELCDFVHLGHVLVDRQGMQTAETAGQVEGFGREDK